jgi:hypothetical protein
VRGRAEGKRTAFGRWSDGVEIGDSSGGSRRASSVERRADEDPSANHPGMAAARGYELRHHPPSRRGSLSILPAAAFLLLVIQQGLESPQRMSQSSALRPPAAVVLAPLCLVHASCRARRGGAQEKRPALQFLPVRGDRAIRRAAVILFPGRSAELRRHPWPRRRSTVRLHCRDESTGPQEEFRLVEVEKPKELTIGSY